MDCKKALFSNKKSGFEPLFLLLDICYFADIGKLNVFFVEFV